VPVAAPTSGLHGAASWLSGVAWHDEFMRFNVSVVNIDNDLVPGMSRR
jgi:hypothetical protein